MTTGETLVIQSEPVAAPVMVDSILDEPEEIHEVRAEETELPPAYIGQKENEPEMPDTAPETILPDQEGAEA